MKSSRRFLLAAVLVLSACRAFGSSQQLYLDALLDFERYAESTLWHDATGLSQPPDSGYWGDGGNSGNGGIRGSCGVAVAYATLVTALPNDPKNSNRIDRIRKALNYAANTHTSGAFVCVNGLKWGWNSGSVVLCSQSGSDWQTPEWSGSMGLACLLVQSNLPVQTILDCQRVVASEADHRASLPPCSGFVGDTKAEENAWQGNILSLAAAWMSTNANAATWLTAAKSYLANTYTVANTTGDPFASWVSTTTLYPSFALENHNFYHPTYEMVAGMSSGDSLLMARLADPNIAAQLQPFAEHNVMMVWKTNLAPMLFDSGEFAYPAGLDWELHDYEQNSYLAWIAAHFNDPQARWADDQLAKLLRYRQIVNGDGTFVGPSSGGFYREAVEARRTAIAWLQWANADFPSGPTNVPGPAIVHFPDVGILAQRSASGFVSVSYKNNIMGMIETAAPSVPTNSYVTTPALPGIFGHGPLGSPTSASLVSLTTNASGFAAQLLVQNGANGSTRVYITSSGDSVGIVEVPLPANGVTGSSAGCFTNGIENDPLTGGSRLVEWTSGATNIAHFSNVARNITNLWVCVSGRYGLAAGPGGYFRYRAANGYNRLGAAQDLLSFSPVAPLPPRFAVWFPNRNAAQTAAAASQISWITNGNNVVLTFPGSTGTTNTIIALITPGNGTWTADADGNWSDPSRWAAGNVADGVASIADLSTLDITADRTVTLDSSRTLGILRFGDTNGLQKWTLNASGGSVLTLAAGTPAIVVNQNIATLSAPLAGTAGFTKSGPGTLVLNGANSISGTLNLDSNSTSANDGAVRIASANAIAGITALVIRNNTGPVAASTLQLDGSGGDLQLTQDLTASCRANTIPTLQNLAGSNLFSGDILMQVGGSNIVVQSDAGTLVLAGTLQYIGSFTSGRSWNFFGAGDTQVAGSILEAANGAPISVGKFGAGTLTLLGNNTFTNALNLNAGTIAFGALSNLGAAGVPLNFNGGTLRFSPGNTADISTHTLNINSGGATIDTGTNHITFAAGIGNNGAGSLTKIGPGTLSLNGANSYSGGTTTSDGTLNVNGSLVGGAVTVAGGTLAGTGTVNGPVLVLAAGTLAPGTNAIGSLTCNNALTNTGRLVMKLSKSPGSLTNDTLKGITTLAFGGTLQLVPAGAPLAYGDAFKLFYATNYLGGFSGILPASPGTNLVWNTASLALNGTLQVALGNVKPQITAITVVGPNFVWNGIGGAAASGYTILSSTNLTTPLALWNVAGTGTFDTNGSFTVTNSLATGSSQHFYAIRIP